jgi:Nif-specific regulatory protein
MPTAASKTVLAGAAIVPAGDNNRDLRVLETILETARTARGARALQQVLDLLVCEGYVAATGERDRLVAENRRLRLELAQEAGSPAIVGGSVAVREVRAQIGGAATTATPVLILGESGVGKSLVAHAIHRQSPRAAKPFVHVVCAGMPEPLVEAQLFGVARGMSDALLPARKGSVDSAAGGVLFLDEVGALSPSAQARLQALLSRRAGGAADGPAVRLITASSRSLEDAVAAGTMRAEFRRWVGDSIIVMPPLRDRKPDLPALIDFFVRRHAREHNRQVRGVSAATLDAMLAYDWPGNVRELHDTIERGVVLATGPLLQEQHLPPAVRTAAPAAPPLGLSEALAGYERELLQDALMRTGGVRSRAARLLKTTDRILGYKIRRHGIDCRRFKSPE